MKAASWHGVKAQLQRRGAGWRQRKAAALMASQTQRHQRRHKCLGPQLGSIQCNASTRRLAVPRRNRWRQKILAAPVGVSAASAGSRRRMAVAKQAMAHRAAWRSAKIGAAAKHHHAAFNGIYGIIGWLRNGKHGAAS